MTDATPPTAPALTVEAWRLIAGWLAAADIDCVEIGAPGGELRMVRAAGVYRVEDMGVRAPAPEASAPVAAVSVVAHCAGRLLGRHPAGATGHLPQPGDRVRAGDIVGLLQIGLLLAPVRAPVGGVLCGPLVAPGTLVGYGTRLTDILPAGDT